MNATIPIDSIWGMLIPLSYDNKKWLVDKLYEDIQRTKPLEEMFARLGDLSKLEKGWDGYNAVPLKPAVVENLQSLLKKCGEDDVAPWVLFPDVDGNIYLDFKSDQVDAGIIISEKEFSYFVDDKDERNVPFSESAVLHVIKNINRTSEYEQANR